VEVIPFDGVFVFVGVGVFLAKGIFVIADKESNGSISGTWDGVTAAFLEEHAAIKATTVIVRRKFCNADPIERDPFLGLFIG
jgi:hypothetical protein